MSNNSETTIYHNVLNRVCSPEEKIVDSEITFKINRKRLEMGRRDNTSSEDKNDTSDELMEVDDELNSRFIADCVSNVGAETSDRNRSRSGDREGETSRARNQADKIIRGAEAAKAHVFGTPGKDQVLYKNTNNCNTSAATVDENYIIVGAHLDEALIDKVKKGAYIDFAWLLPHEKQFEEDHRLELIYKGDQTYFMPVAECEGASGRITNLHKWEQAFSVFSNIYLKEFPHKATELIQYNHVICTAASSYLWENVYAYDKEFRMHLSKYPDRSWGVILQQAWTMILKD